MVLRQIIAKLNHITFIPSGSRSAGIGNFDFVLKDGEPEPPTKEKLVVLESTDKGKTWTEKYRKPGYVKPVKPPKEEKNK